MAHCLIALGSNLGDRAATLRTALSRIDRQIGTVLSVSAFHATSPIGGPAEQSAFLNAAAVCQTDLTPERVLEILHGIEQSLGRTREQRWGPRTLDLDLLAYDDLVVDTPALQVPHPRLTFRRFVLEPVVEIAAAQVHAPTGLTMRQLLDRLHATPRYVVYLGQYAADAARQTAEQTGALLLLDDDHLSQVASDATPRCVSGPGPWRKVAAENSSEAKSAWLGPHLVIWNEPTGPLPEDALDATVLAAIRNLRSVPILRLAGVSQETLVAEGVAAMRAME